MRLVTLLEDYKLGRLQKEEEKRRYRVLIKKHDPYRIIYGSMILAHLDWGQFDLPFYNYRSMILSDLHLDQFDLPFYNYQPDCSPGISCKDQTIAVLKSSLNSFFSKRFLT